MIIRCAECGGDHVYDLGMNVDKNAVQRIENGKRFVTDIELKVIAKVLKVSCDFLLEDGFLDSSAARSMLIKMLAERCAITSEEKNSIRNTDNLEKTLKEVLWKHFRARSRGLTKNLMETSINTIQKVKELLRVACFSEINDYIINPFGSLISQGITITSSAETFSQMERFIEDCDCHEMILPRKCLTLFENVNGINIPKNITVDENGESVVRIEKPEQIDEVILTVENHDVYRDSIMLRSFWGSKRRRMVIQLPTISISLLFEGTSININLTFTDKRSAKGTLDDLTLIDLWHKGNTLVFSKILGSEVVTVLKIPPIEDEPVIELLSNYVSRNKEIYRQVMKLERYLKTEFVLPNNLTYADKCAIEKVLSFFEPVEVEDTIWDLDLQINCDNQLYESLKKPSIHPMKMIEKGEETVHLFGHEYVIAEQQISIPRPVIKNTDEVRDALLSGGQPTAKIVSYTGKLVLRCKMKQM